MGYQVLLSHSEENDGVDCLDVIPGKVTRFQDPLIDADGARLKVPHMGWSQVAQAQKHPMWNRISDQARFYFAHSYYCVPSDQSVVTGTTQYGQNIAVSVAYGKLFACQFHPEKSSKDGLQFLENFTRWQGDAS
jgi:glutamine amidotransferase